MAKVKELTGRKWRVVKGFGTNSWGFIGEWDEAMLPDGLKFLRKCDNITRITMEAKDGEVAIMWFVEDEALTPEQMWRSHWTRDPEIKNTNQHNVMSQCQAFAEGLEVEEASVLTPEAWEIITKRHVKDHK